MGQMILIDEDRLNELKTHEHWFYIYFNIIGMIQKKFYPNFIIGDPVTEQHYRAMFMTYLFWRFKKENI